jgi:hypothetical protein
VCHFPPGTSKWNKIEHRLFSRISSNWRGRPLTSHEVVVGTIGATTTRTGLTVHSELDPGAYPTGVTIPDEVMVALPLTAHDWHGTWNYTLRPEPPAPLPVPRYEDRTQPADRAPDWLHHPTLTGMDTRAFADLLAAVEQYLLDHPPISLHHKRARHRILRRGPLSLSDRLLVTVLRHRWKTQIRALTSLLGSPANAVGDALHEVTPVLEASTGAPAKHPSPHPPQQTSPTSSAEPTPRRASNSSAAPWPGSSVKKNIRRQRCAERFTIYVRPVLALIASIFGRRR